MLKMICSLRLYRLCDMPAKTKLQKQMLILEWWVQRRRVLSNNGSGRRCSNGVCDQSSRLWSKKNFPWSGKVMISILLWVRREKECCEMLLSLWRCSPLFVDAAIACSHTVLCIYTCWFVCLRIERAEDNGINTSCLHHPLPPLFFPLHSWYSRKCYLF